MEKFDINRLQREQVAEFIGESENLANYNEEFLLLRETEGWIFYQDAPIVPPEGKIMIGQRQYNGAESEYETAYKIVDSSHRAKFEGILKLNQLPDFAEGLEIVDFRPIRQYEAVSAIVSLLSEKVSAEAENFNTWSDEQKKEFLTKWGVL